MPGQVPGRSGVDPTHPATRSTVGAIMESRYDADAAQKMVDELAAQARKLNNSNKFAEGLAAAREAIAIRERRQGAHHRDTARVRTLVAEILVDKGDYRDAAAAAELASHDLEADKEASPADVEAAYSQLSNARFRAGDFAGQKDAADKAKAAMDLLKGSSFTYDLTTYAGVQQYRTMNTGMEILWSDQQLMDFANAGGTLAELFQMGIIHMRPFAEGGPVTETGPAIVQNFVGQTSTPVNALVASAAPGQTVILWGTGLGPITGDETQPPAGGDMPNVPVELFVGTTKASVTYRGRAPGFAGVDQINFQVPLGQLGCNIPVAVKIGSLVSNFATLAVSNGGACSDSNGISADTLQQLNSRGNIAIGTVVLSRNTSQISLPPPLPSQSTTTESGSAVFARFTRDAFLQSASSFSTVSVGGCVVAAFRGQSASAALGSFTGLDAGPAINVIGPNGSRQLSKSSQIAGTYSAQLTGPNQPPYLTAGNYTASGPGGADVGAFQASLTTAASLNWLNQSSISTVNRSQDLQILWNGGGNGLVTITGTSLSGSSSSSVGGVFSCLAPASAGQFTVPSVVLLALPPSSQVGSGGISIPTGFLFVGTQTSSSFTASGLDQAFALFSDSTGKGVNFQ